jgi:iron complex outermembrane recepter protein
MHGKSRQGRYNPAPGVGARSGLLLRRAVVGGALCCLSPAWTQEPALEEFVVTARRRTENLQDTPVSISAFTTRDLEQRTVTALPDVADYTPNLRRSAGPQGGSSAHYYIRGLGQLDFIASTDPGVGVYVDGVYLGRTTGATFDLLDVERIEVLRGPQGTLFGRNTIGGAISVISSAPPLEPRARVAVSLTSPAKQEARLMFGGPLGSGRVAADAAVLVKSQDGWQRRLIDGLRFGAERTYATRGVLDWHAADRLDLRAEVDATRSRGTADPHLLAAANPVRGGRPEFVVADPEITWSSQWSNDDLDVRGASLVATYELAHATLKSITAYRTLDSATGIDFDGSPHDDLDQLVQTAQRQRSEELQLTGRAHAERLDWLVGTFWFDEAVDQAIPIVFYGTRISQNNALDNRSAALYAHVSYALTERLGVSGGFRSTKERKAHAFNHAIGSGGTQTPLFPPTTLRNDWRSSTPKIGVEYRLDGGALLYASIGDGFRSGGFNGRPFGTDEFLSYEPETLRTLELGAKSEWLDGRLRLNAALFASRYYDIQLTHTAIGVSGAPIVATGNAGEAELEGFELEATWAPSERVLVTASAGNLHSRYTELEPGATVSADDDLPVAPRWTINAGIEYRFAAASAGAWRTRVDYSYTSRFNYFFENPPGSWQEAHGLWHVRVGYEPAGAAWQLAAFIRNLRDERYQLFREDVRDTFGVSLDWPARPREWGVEFTYLR